MFNFDNLKVARKNIAEKRGGSAESAYNEGVKILDLYRQMPGVTRLDEAGKRFIEALQYNSEHVQSIIYLSYILYALENEPMALKYIKMAERLRSPLPAEIIKYKKAIEEKLDM